MVPAREIWIEDFMASFWVSDISTLPPYFITLSFWNNDWSLGMLQPFCYNEATIKWPNPTFTRRQSRMQESGSLTAYLKSCSSSGGFQFGFLFMWKNKHLGQSFCKSSFLLVIDECNSYWSRLASLVLEISKMLKTEVEASNNHYTMCRNNQPK